MKKILKQIGIGILILIGLPFFAFFACGFTYDACNESMKPICSLIGFCN